MIYKRYPLGACIPHSNGADSFAFICGFGKWVYSGTTTCNGVGILEHPANDTCINSQKFICINYPAPTPSPTPTPIPPTGFEVSTRHISDNCDDSPNGYEFTYYDESFNCTVDNTCSDVWENGVLYQSMFVFVSFLSFIIII